MFISDEQLHIGDEYHQQSKYIRKGQTQIQDYGSMVELKRDNLPKSIRLSVAMADDGASIWEVIGQRRSIRSFLSLSLNEQHLSQLLWATQGVTKKREAARSFRAAPSAGALFPIETYVFIQRVEPLKPGIYHYNFDEHSLSAIAFGNVIKPLAGACMNQSAVVEAAVVLAWSAVIERCTDQYKQRGYRYLYMEAGHICQNLYLAATAIGIGSCAIGAFYDDEVNRLLGIDADNKETIIYMAGVGQV